MEGQIRGFGLKSYLAGIYAITRGPESTISCGTLAENAHCHRWLPHHGLKEAPFKGVLREGTRYILALAIVR